MKAVIQLGSTQYIVQEKDVIKAVMAVPEKKKFSVPVLATIDGGKVAVGTPEVKGVTVELTAADEIVKADKVTAVRYKAKKRVLKVRGHKQHQVQLTVGKIS